MRAGRAVTKNHVLFNESIEAFRPKEITNKPYKDDAKIFGYLLLDFILEKPLNFKSFIIYPTNQVGLAEPYQAFVAQVELPEWIDRYNAHFFTIALSSIISFITSRPVKSPRDNYYSRGELKEHDLLELAIQFPVLTAGPGFHRILLSDEQLESTKEKIDEFISLLFKMPYGDYKKAMRTIRLVHLAHNNVRDDFALAYYLFVSSIESVAQISTNEKHYRKKHYLEKEWEELASSDQIIMELFKEYKKIRNENKYLKERTIDFIMDNCPPSKWELLEYPLDFYNSLIFNLTGEPQRIQSTKKSWFEKYPSDLSHEELRGILGDMYKHRSKFTHRGENPPHKDPLTDNKFFEEITEFDFMDNNTGDTTYKTILVPNIRLISFIARESICNYFRLKVKGK